LKILLTYGIKGDRITNVAETVAEKVVNMTAVCKSFQKAIVKKE